MPLCAQHAKEQAEQTYLAYVNDTNVVVRTWQAIAWLCLLAVVGCAVAQVVIGEHVFQITMVMLIAIAVKIVAAMYVCGYHIPLEVGDVLYKRKKAEQEKGIY